MIKRSPHNVSWIFVIGLIISFFITKSYLENSVLDINVHDTYFVIAHVQIYIIFISWFLLCGFGYWVLKRFEVKLFSFLTVLHLIASLFGIIQLIRTSAITNFPKRFYQNLVYPEESYSLIICVWIFFFIGQLTYFLNILISTIRKKSNKPN
ncbi:hypothetical protein MTsPCn9_19490 [Croceitalea sp. MTPC9]|nr:hypothetical protein MTsPCn6_12340 [Croceitalea sp. MTPC6]GMN17013.1 hypothetical protein MTsPCn9_19490 [Croceitalea sp. MTPC9]